MRDNYTLHNGSALADFIVQDVQTQGVGVIYPRIARPAKLNKQSLNFYSVPHNRIVL
uniref:Uncharacterized protein n=1 Tax=Siphoviridae sp. ctu9a31 TaxID=2825712 RepID=A0A8S5Q9V5_9CAUD|nr:MAG TPA: hypothetical protein [Siphoviridae sp. ctu9a31]